MFNPRRTCLCKEALEKADVYNRIEILDLHFDLIPLEKDLLSMEMEDCFQKMHIDGDLSTYSYVVESIQRLELILGKIPNIFSIGNGAKIV